MDRKASYEKVKALLHDALADFAANRVFDAIEKTERATYLMRETQSIRQAGYLAQSGEKT